MKTSSYLTQLKVIATFLVVLVHSKNLLGYASYTEHNPLISFCNVFAAAGILIFFVVSGYLLFIKDFDYSQNLKKKIKSLVIPFFVWNVFWILFEMIGVLILPEYFEDSIANGFSEWIMFLFGIPFYKAPFYTPLWFARDLFMLNVFAPVLRWIIDRFPVCLTLVILAGLWLVPLPYEIWYNLCQSIVFFTLGGLIARRKLTFPSKKNSRIISILSFIIIVIAVCIPGLNMWSYYSRFLLILAVIVIGVSVSEFNIKGLKKFMPYSFLIYVLHGKPMSVLQIIYVNLIPQNNFSVVIGYFFIPIILIALCIIAAYILKRFLPRVYSISTGSR